MLGDCFGAITPRFADLPFWYYENALFHHERYTFDSIILRPILEMVTLLGLESETAMRGGRVTAPITPSLVVAVRNGSILT